jgi:DNA-binding NarL/FixJ family response regulator
MRRARSRCVPPAAHCASSSSRRCRTSLYRIVQESLTNVVKHARATPRECAREPAGRSGGRSDRGRRRRIRPRPDRRRRDRTARGSANQEIAKLLFISVRTAETHRAHIMQKLRLETRAELERYALDQGLLEPE